MRNERQSRTGQQSSSQNSLGHFARVTNADSKQSITAQIMEEKERRYDPEGQIAQVCRPLLKD